MALSRTDAILWMAPESIDVRRTFIARKKVGHGCSIFETLIGSSSADQGLPFPGLSFPGLSYALAAATAARIAAISAA